MPSPNHIETTPDGVNTVVVGLNGDDGLSAYELAVSTGFTGTLLEWLEFVKGPKGDKGDPGEKGDKGDLGDISTSIESYPNLATLDDDTKFLVTARGDLDREPFTALLGALKTLFGNRQNHNGEQAIETITGLAASLAANANGAKAYATLVALQAVTTNPADTLAYVTNDPTALNNGLYRYSGTVWVKSVYDPLAQSLAAIASAFTNVGLRREPGRVIDDQGNPVPWAVSDAAGSSPLYVTDKGTVQANGMGVKPFTVGAYGLAHVFADLLDNIAGGITTDGGFQIADNLKINFRENCIWPIVVADLQNNVSCYMTNKGEWYFNFEEGVLPAPPASNPLTLAHLAIDLFVAIMHVLCYGQSLSRGNNALPLLSIIQPYLNLTFNGGVRNEGGLPNTSFIPLVEQVNGVRGETPCSGTVNMLAQLLTQSGFQQPVFLANAPGEGGKSINELDKGTIYYDRLIASIADAKTISTGLGKTYNVPFMIFNQGQADHSDGTSLATYKALFEAFQDDFTNDVVAITGQSFIPALIVTQCTSFKHTSATSPVVALAQLQSANQRADIHIAAPEYIFDKAADFIHLTNEGSRMQGYYFAICAARAVFGDGNWKPLQPVRTVFGASFVDIYYNVPFGVLQFSTDKVTQKPNNGFDIYDASGTRLTITSTTITGNKIRLAIPSPVPVGGSVTYGFGRTGDPAQDGPTSGASGNVCDGQGEAYSYIDSTGAVRRLDNYSVVFKTVNN